MKKQLKTGLAVAWLALTVGGVAAWAQKSVTIDVPFSFLVGSKEFPAGRYIISQPNPDGSSLVLRSADGRESTMIHVLTRLSEREGNSAQVVFDKSQEKNYLSEVYIPGMDGFHLQGAPGRHAHAKVQGK